MRFNRWSVQYGQRGAPWRFRNRRPTNHPRTSFQTRVFATPSLRAFFVDGLLASASDVVVVRFLSIYAIALGASNAQIGLIAAANGLAGILALPIGARIAERASSRKWVVLIAGGGMARGCIVLMALTPLLLTDNRAVLALIVLSSLKWFLGSIGHPSWVSLTADIVPLDLRRFYISRRMLGIAVVAAIGAPIAGFAIRLLGGIEGVTGFQWAFMAAAVLGFTSTWFYSRIQEPERPAEGRPSGSTRAMLRDPLFVRYMSGTFLLHTMTMIAGPFFAAYLVRNLGASTTQVGILGTVDAASAVVGQFVAGYLAVKYGSWRLMRWSMLLLPLMPVLWAVSTNPWHTVLPHIIGGAAWAMWNLTAFNLVLEYAPPANLPRYSATQQVMVLAASFVGPLIGTAIVAVWGLRAAMLISSAGRIVAFGVMTIPVKMPPEPAEPEPPLEAPPPPVPVATAAAGGLPDATADEATVSVRT